MNLPFSGNEYILAEVACFIEVATKTDFTVYYKGKTYFQMSTSGRTGRQADIYSGYMVYGPFHVSTVS